MLQSRLKNKMSESMKNQRTTSIMIFGSKLRQNMQYNFNVMLRTHSFQIIRGTVYDHNKKPSKGAVIQITQIRMDNNRRQILGYSYTDEKGQYVFTIQALSYMKYEMTVYAPLS